jgi:hypothetical protein
MVTFDATQRAIFWMLTVMVVILLLLSGERRPHSRFRSLRGAIPKTTREWLIRGWGYYVLQCRVLGVQRIWATVERAGFSFVMPT